MMKNRKKYVLILGTLILLLTGCGKSDDEERDSFQSIDSVLETDVNTYDNHEKQIKKKVHNKDESNTASPKVVVIDPGHASSRTTDYEPVGPGAQETKMASVIGTRGVSTGVYEYERVLQISLLLREELQNRGYQVIMTKANEDEVLSNIQRAQIANDVNADAFLRIHADASDNSLDNGAMAMCITPDNPFVPLMYESSRMLADCVIDQYCRSTGFQNNGVVETDSMTGNNWSQVPCILLELGYMTNTDDDQRLASADVQTAIVRGIADGLDLYFTGK